MNFKKQDDNKPQMGYLPWKQLESIARVFDYGAIKYGRDNWKNCPSKMRYISAAIRHISKWCCGEKNDPETGESHITHAICSLLIALWLIDNKEDQENIHDHKQFEPYEFKRATNMYDRVSMLNKSNSKFTNNK